LTDSFKEKLLDDDFRKQVINLLYFAKRRNNLKYQPTYFTYINNIQINTGFKISQRYKKIDVLQILDYGNYEPSTVFGYPKKIIKPFLPIFINLHKNLDEKDPKNYQENFFNNKTFIWSTREDETSESNVINELNNHIKTLVFARYDDKDTEAYFLGVAIPTLFEAPKESKGQYRYKLDFEVEIDKEILTLIGAKF